MMHSDHMIAQCGWRSVFDQQTKAVELQDFISRWSNTILVEVLDKYFTHICPATQTWRIDTLQLDLGDIALDDLPTELPKRLHASLHDAFGRLLTQQRLAIGSSYRSRTDNYTNTDNYTSTNNYTSSDINNSNNNLRILDHSISLQDFVSWFLRNGTLPWWYKGSASAVQILKDQIDQCPQATVAIVRALGQTEAVRRRLVWQAGELLVRKLVQLLEPWQGGFICAYADNLFKVQVQRPLATDSALEFRQHIWFTILTYLLVERGTLFNTIAFMRATLWQTAQRYQIDYQQLLAQLSSAVIALESMGLVTPVFLAAIVTISEQDQHYQKNSLADKPVPIDYWALLQQMLQRGKAWQNVQQANHSTTTLHIDELFTALAQEDAERMAKLLKEEGKSETVRKKLLQNFSFTELALVVRVVAPHDHLFILAHVEQAQPLITQQTGDEKVLWQVLLAYLFVERGSYFNRRQFVHDTLMRVCNLQQLDFQVLLDLLMNTIVQNSYGQHFELLAIFQDLKVDFDRRQPAPDSRHLYWQSLTHYLNTGKESSTRDAAAVTGHYSALFYRLLNTTVLLPANATKNCNALVLLLRGRELASLSDQLLSHRLLQLLRPGDVRVLFGAIQPDASEFCCVFMRAIFRWHRQALLPALAGMDVGFAMPALIIQALLATSKLRRGLTKPFNLADFWKNFTLVLQQQTRIDLTGFQQQLVQVLTITTAGKTCYQSAQQINISGANSHSLQALLNCLPAAIHLVAPEAGVAPAQHFAQLRHWLFAPAGGTQAETALTESWSRIMAAQSAHCQQSNTDFKFWLNRQPDKSRLLTLLLSQRHIKPINNWLLAQLPHELNPPDSIIKLWRDLLLNSGLWHGTSAVLQQRLEDIFWSGVFVSSASAVNVDQLLARIFTLACLRLNINLNESLRLIQRDLPELKQSRWPQVYNLLLAQTRAAGEPTVNNITQGHPLPSVTYHLVSNTAAAQSLALQKNTSYFQQDYLAHYLNHGRLADILRSLLQLGRLPANVVAVQPVELDRLLFDIFTHCPERLPALIGSVLQHQGVIFRLVNLVPFSWLLAALRKTAGHHYSTITLIEAFYQSLQQINLPQLSPSQRLGSYFHLVIKNWLNHDWAALAPDKLVSSYCWQLMQQQGLAQVELQRAFAGISVRLPDVLQLSIARVLDLSPTESAVVIDAASANSAQIPPAKKRIPARSFAHDPVHNPGRYPQPETVSMKINNAGLAIIQSFISPLFSRLGLTSEGKFVTDSARRRAVHYLQYLASGSCATAEQDLVLNKLLCGLAVHEPVEFAIEISAAERELCESLLTSVIAYWPAIGSSSIEGFRGNWLVRDASLTDAKDRWDLIVEKRAYDPLLARSPFSYSVINLPWMVKPVYVTWPT